MILHEVHEGTQRGRRPQPNSRFITADDADGHE